MGQAKGKKCVFVCSTLEQERERSVSVREILLERKSRISQNCKQKMLRRYQYPELFEPRFVVRSIFRLLSSRQIRLTLTGE